MEAAASGAETAEAIGSALEESDLMLPRPMATYSPLGAADSGYQTDSPLLSMDAATFEARSTPAASASALASSVAASRHQQRTPPPGTFRPVSPEPLLPHHNDGGGGGGFRHVATQTFQLQQYQHDFDSPSSQPFQQQPQQLPPFLSQQSTGFRPASAPLYDLSPSGVGDAGGAFGGNDEDNAELEEDFDEEVYRSSVFQPLPDLLGGETAARHRSRSVPVTDERARERVALLLREIGDRYNESRLSPAAPFQAAAPWLIRARLAGGRNRDRRISLRVDPTDVGGGGDGGGGGDSGGDWGGAIIGWVARMARTLSGADIAREDEEQENSSDERDD